MFTNTSAQNLKKTFYDLNGTKPKEVYYENNKGEKNGSYKSYFDDGLVSVESNYKNGALDGVYKEYQWLGGKAALKIMTTYKDGVKNGAAVYYGGLNFSIKTNQGNFVNDQKDGLWKVTEETSATMPDGFKYFTYNQTFKDGKMIEESQTWYYFPSNKVFAETKNGTRTSFSPEGKKTGEETFNTNGELVEERFFYLSGAVAENNKYSVMGGSKFTEKNSWYENGKVKKKEGYSNGSTLLYYEGYNVDGSKDANMLQIEKNEQKEKEQVASQKIKFNAQTRKADSLFNIKAYNKASEEYSNMSRNADTYIERRSANDTSNLGFLNGKKQYAQSKINEIKKIAEMSDNVKKQFAEITSKYNKFTSLFGAPSFPKGENLYTKADAHYKELETAYKKETDVVKGLDSGKKLIEILDKLIALGDTDTKEIDKKLKKAKTKEEETQLLGY